VNTHLLSLFEKLGVCDRAAAVAAAAQSGLSRGVQQDLALARGELAGVHAVARHRRRTVSRQNAARWTRTRSSA
jgi:hypothetical protein